MFKKIIIYGHKLHSHTHSYIHQAFYNAFKHKGYETHWIDENDDISNFDFSNSLFLTEGQVLKNIPERDDCKYLFHFVDSKDRESLNIKDENIINFYFYENKVKDYEKINDFSYFDQENGNLYFPWAATLFPHQIDICRERTFNPNQTNVNFIGSVWDVNESYINDFKKSCEDSNKKFVWRRLLNEKEYYLHTINSYVTVDFRGKVHLDIGYLPCRIFKSLGIGVPPGTNSKFVKEAFGEHVFYTPDSYDILEGTAEFWRNKSTEAVRSGMNFIRDKHTYLNRIDDIFRVINES